MSGSYLATPAWPSSSRSRPAGTTRRRCRPGEPRHWPVARLPRSSPSAVRRWASSYTKRCHRSSPGLRHRGRRRSQDPLSCRHGRHRRGTGRNRWHCSGAAGASSRCRRPFDEYAFRTHRGRGVGGAPRHPGEHGDERSDPRTFSKDRPIPYLRCWGDADPNSIAPPRCSSNFMGQLLYMTPVLGFAWLFLVINTGSALLAACALAS